MTQTETAPQVSRRVSPFVVVSETSLRFLLLLLATAASTIYAWQYIYVVVRTQRTLDGYLACAALTGDAYSRCIGDQVAGPLGRGLSVGLALSVVTVAAAVLLAPGLKRKVAGWTEPPEPLAQRLNQDVAQWAKAINVVPPAVMLSRSPAATARMSSGGIGRARLVLGAGMVAVRETDRAAYDAVIGHELAHVRNRDIRVTAVAIAAWWALVVVAAGPYAVAAAVSGHADSVLAPLAKTLAVVLAARLVRNALLRARELDADVRASQVPGLFDPLHRIVTRSAPRRRRPLAWSSHPTPERRGAAITNPDSVLRLSWLDIGLLAATAYFLVPALSFWLQQLTFGRAVSPDLATAVSWLIGGAGVGLGVWIVITRDELARVATGQKSPRRALIATLALAAGTGLGALLIPLPRSANDDFGHRSVLVWTAIGLTALISSWLVVSWTSLLARRMTSRLGSRRRFRLTFLVGAVATGCASALLYDFGQKLLVVTALPEVGPGTAVMYAALFTWVQHGGWLLFGALGAALLLRLLTRPQPAPSRWLYLVEPPASASTKTS